MLQLDRLLFCLGVIVFKVIADSREEQPIEREVKFTVLPQNLMVNEGGTIRLPCFVDDIEGFVLLWKLGETILSVGGRVIDSSERQQRLQLEEETNGNYLVIHSASSEDTGEYLCQISAFVPRDIRHHVIVRTRPEVRVDTRRVKADTGDNVTEARVDTGDNVRVDTRRVVADTGDNVTLTCSLVSGHPLPEVTWTKVGDDSEAIHNYNLHLINVSWTEAGQYQCRADNGFIDDHRVDVSLMVHHPPYIYPDTQWVHASHEDRGHVEVKCRVSSYPPADVVWFREQEDEPLSSLQHNMSQEVGDVQVWSLEVEVHESEDSHYTCVASNSHGEARMEVTVTNRPDKPQLYQNQTSLYWSVHSSLPVSVFQLETSWNTKKISVSPSHHQEDTWFGSWTLETVSGPEPRWRVSGYNKHGAGPVSDWTRLVDMSTSGHPELAPVLSLIIVSMLLTN